MRLINVIEIKKGLISNIRSFVISDQAELNIEDSRQVITRAKSYFLDKLAENGCPNLMKALEKDHEWDNGNGYNIIMRESDKVTT